MNYYSAEWPDGIYPLPGYVVEEIVKKDDEDYEDNLLPTDF